MKKVLFVAGALCAASLFAAQQNFATDVEAFLAAHKIAGVESFQGLLKVMGEPCGAAASIDATVLPKHKARKVRLWRNRLPKRHRQKSLPPPWRSRNQSPNRHRFLRKRQRLRLCCRLTPFSPMRRTKYPARPRY